MEPEGRTTSAGGSRPTRTNVTCQFSGATPGFFTRIGCA